MQISISALNLYLQCPRAYRLCEIDGVAPQRKGVSLCRANSVRKVMAQLHGSGRRMQDYAQDELYTICERAWNEETNDPTVDQAELTSIVVQEKPGKQSTVPAVTKGERVLENIKTWCFEYSREEFDTEVLYGDVSFRTVIGDVSFVGHIDLVRKHPELGLQIIRFDTGAQSPNPAHLERDFSLSLYAHAIWQGVLYPRYPDLAEEIRPGIIPSVYVYYLPALERYQKKTGNFKKGDRKGNPLNPIKRTKEQLLDFEYEILYTTAGIESGFFPMLPTTPCRCSLCAYVHGCKRTRTTDISFNVEEFEKAEEYKEVSA